MERLENDMDDLFRKAGELYPLKITESDWDGVAGKLQEAKFGDEQTMPGAQNIGTGNKRKWLFLLFLIPIALVGLIYSTGSIRKHPGASAQLTMKNTSVPVAGSDAKGSTAKQTQLLHRADQNKSSENIILKAASVKPSVDKSRRVASVKPSDNKLRQVATVKRSDDKILQASTAAPDELNENRKTPGHPVTKNVIRKKISQNTGFSDNLRASHEANDNGNKVRNGNAIAQSSNGETDPSVFDEQSFQSLLAKPLSLTAVSNRETISVHAIPPRENSVELPDNLNGAIKDVDVKPTKGLYAGLLVGPDLSAVKFQSVKQLGFSLGARIGYQFKNRLSVETGLLWDKKYYYSKGEYFNKSEAGLQFDILNLEGSCNMFEIPLAVRYDFSTHKNHNFFIKGGISSYLMKKENYSYNAEGVYGPWQGDSTYYNSTNNIFSIVQLSAGYELAVGRKTKISFEPYVKIPLHGIGIGGMPISSAGLYIGITHSFR